MEFLQNLGTTELILIVVAVGFLVWKFVFNSSTNVNDILAKLKGSATANTTNITPAAKVVVNAQGQQVLVQAPPLVSGTTLVADWEKLYNELEANGLTEATAKLDEVWPSLNPKRKAPAPPAI